MGGLVARNFRITRKSRLDRPELNAKNTTRLTVILDIGDRCARNAGRGGTKIFERAPHDREWISYVESLF
jgi:hypothetical protein